MIWEVSKTPKAKTLVAPASISFIASLVDQFDGCRPVEVEGRTLHVQGTPITVLAVQVDPPFRKSRRQKPPRSARAEPSNGALNIIQAEMYEAVSSKNKIGVRQGVTRYVDREETSSDFNTLRAKGIRGDQRRHDIHARVIQILNAMRNPTGVATWSVKQRAHPQSLQ